MYHKDKENHKVIFIFIHFVFTTFIIKRIIKYNI